MRALLRTLLVASVLLLLPAQAMAYTITLTDKDNPNYGATVEVTGDGTNSVTFSLTLTPTIGDLRGLFFDIENPAGDLSFYNLTGTYVDESNVTYEPGKVTKAGSNSNNIKGLKVGGKQAKFDIGIEIGSQGASPDFIPTTTFVFSTVDGSVINLGSSFALRSMSMGEEGGSAKMYGTGGGAETPEPASMLLLASAAGAIGWARRRRNRE